MPALFLCCLLEWLAEQTMLGTVPEQHSVAAFGKPDLRIPFWPAFDDDDLLAGYQGGKGQIVFLFHGVNCGEEPLGMQPTLR